MNELDIILFQGLDEILGQLGIQYREGESSHIGIIVTRRLLPHVKRLEDGKLYVLESLVIYPIYAAEPTGYLGALIRDLDEILNLGPVKWLGLDISRKIEIEKYLFSSSSSSPPLSKILPCYREEGERKEEGKGERKRKEKRKVEEINIGHQSILLIRDRDLRLVATKTYLSPELISIIFQKNKIEDLLFSPLLPSPFSSPFFPLNLIPN